MPQATATTRSHLVLWAFIAWTILALLLGGFALIHHDAVQADLARWETDRRRYEVWRDVYAAAHGFIGRSVRSIEVREYGGTPLVVLPADVFGPRCRMPARALDDRFDGWQIEFQINEHGKVCETSLVPTPGVAYISPDHELDLLEALRRWLLITGLLIWTVAFLAACGAGRVRRRVAQLGLACVAMSAVMWLLQPMHLPFDERHRRWFSYALAGTGFLSVCAMLLPHWKRRWRRVGPPRCRRCGYNLTGNESGVCPECGKEIPRPKPDPWVHEVEALERLAARS